VIALPLGYAERRAIPSLQILCWRVPKVAELIDLYSDREPKDRSLEQAASVDCHISGSRLPVLWHARNVWGDAKWRELSESVGFSAS